MDSYPDDNYWWAADRAEAAYFAHIEKTTHNYPPNRQTGIVCGNEPINWEKPF